MSLYTTLEEKISTDEIVSLFYNADDPNTAAVGFVCAVDDDYVMLEQVSVVGEYDGFALRPMEDIFRVDAGTYYETTLHKVYHHKKQTHSNPGFEENLLTDLLLYAAGEKLVVSISAHTYEDISCTGYVQEVDEEEQSVTVHVISRERHGAFDGYITVSYDSITKLTCDSEKDRMLQLLNELL